MSDQVILDRGEWPGVPTATAAAQQIGAVGWMAYVGGRSLFFPPWPADGIRGLAAAGLGILPVYAMGSPLTQAQGSGDGQTAVGLTQAAGVSGGSLIMLMMDAIAALKVDLNSLTLKKV